MPTIISVGAFILFLVTFGIWIATTNKLNNYIYRSLLSGRIFWTSQLRFLHMTLPIILLIYFLAGFWSWTFSMLLVASAQIGVVVSAILFVLFRKSAQSKWVEQQYVAGVDIGIGYNWLEKWLKRIFRATNLFYVILVGFTHFTQIFPSPELTFISFRNISHD